MDEQDIKDRRNALTHFASRYWAGEAEVARTFFSAKRSPQEHLRWLWLQAYKELQPRPDGLILRLVDQIKDGYAVLEVDQGRAEYLETIKFLEEEFRHYVVFADVIESITGEHITTDVLATYEYPEEHSLRMLRQGYIKQHGRLARFASSFCEGGGASIFFEGMHIGGDELSEQIAAACRNVHDDEVGHAEHGAENLHEGAQTEDEWQLAGEMVEAISRQRLRMRNEQFGFVLSEDRVNDIGDGNIELPDRLRQFLV